MQSTMSAATTAIPSPVRLSAPGRVSPVDKAPPLAALMSAASEMVPFLREKAQATEQARRVSEETTDLFRKAGFFRLMQPARYGGYEYGFTAFSDIICELGRGCTASAWGCSLGAIHQWMLGTFPAQAQDDVWQDDPGAICAASYAPVVVAEAVDGGYTIHGKWLFASNVDNAQWGIVGVQFPPTKKGDTPGAGFLLVPRSEWSIEDNWFVAGQAGTGSKTIVIDKPTFVPAHRRLTFAEASSNMPPGLGVNPNPIYRIPFLSAVPVCLVAPLLGTARGAVEAFVDLCSNRVTRGAVAGGGNRLSQFFPVQSRLAEAAAAIDAAELLIDRDTTEVENMAANNVIISVEQRIRNRRDHAYAAKLAQGAVDTLFAAVGGNGLALDQPLQRMWRDSNAIARHISLNWDAVSSMVGQHMLGLEPKGQY